MITEATGVGLGLVVTFVLSVAGVIGLFAVMRYRLGRLERSTSRRLKDHGGRLRGLEDWKLQAETERAVREGKPLPQSRIPTGPVDDTITGFDADESSQ